MSLSEFRFGKQFLAPHGNGSGACGNKDNGLEIKQKPMSFELDWFSLKEPLSECVGKIFSKLTDKQIEEFKNRGGNDISFLLIYNIGHPFRWCEDFPRNITLNSEEQELPISDNSSSIIEITVSSLLRQVAAHLSSWEPGGKDSVSNIFKASAKDVAKSLEILSDLTEEKKIGMQLQRISSEPRFKISTLITTDSNLD